MAQRSTLRFFSGSAGFFQLLSPLLLMLMGLVFMPPALAHHAIGEQTPTNFLEGFLSGLAHPVIGLDHLAFVVAIGLLTARQSATWSLPGTFVGAAMLGTGLYVQQIDLPLVEPGIALSVLLFGGLLLLNRQFSPALLLALGAIAGLLHGYVYGESIIGAGMPPLVAYLLGFTLTQFGLAMSACWVGNRLLQGAQASLLRYAGWAIAAIGLVFLSRTAIG